MHFAVCVGCGCDDDHPCQLGALGDVSCRWLRVHRPKRLGVCSSCHGLHWLYQAELRSDPEFAGDRFAELLEAVYGTHEEGLRWYDRPQQALNGKTPRALVIAGNIRRARQAVNQMLDEVFL